MRTVAIAVSYNEDFQLTAFRAHHDVYRDQLFAHVIVDNGSRPDYVARLRRSFPSSTILELGANGGTTAAFNAGIRYALADPGTEAILLTVQDVQLDREFLPEATAVLASDRRIAAVGGIVFAAGTEHTVESYGGTVDWDRFTLEPLSTGVDDPTVLPDTRDVDFIPGGITLFRREAFERVGVQDEQLFMYCDELDWIFRARRLGLRATVTKRARAWHQHVSTADPAARTLRATFYTLRNQVYLVGKHRGRATMLRHCARSILAALSHPGAGPALVLARVAGPLYGALGVMGPRLFARR